MISSLFTFFVQPKAKNQRRVPRYGVGSLRAWIQQPGLLGMFEKHIELSPIDFNQTGMAFRHDHLLIPGQSVVLDLKKEKHSLMSVVATVCYTSQQATHYRSGVEFDFEANDHMRLPEVKQELVEIEALLKGVVILSEV
jgi:hypothetical protein